MNHLQNNWIHLFEITNIGKHKDGFTLYEVVSMIYPNSCPDALTKMIVWKRYSDFKVLYNDIKRKHKILKINDRIPKLSKASYFKRFADKEIEERRKCALRFLEYIGKYPALFTSDCFVKFFETSYVPVHQIKGNIDAIRSELKLPNPPDVISINSLSSEEEINLGSDTESVSTRSITSISLHSQGTDIQSIDSFSHQKSDSLSIDSFDSETSKVSKLIHEKHLPSIPESTIETIFLSNGISNNVFPTPPSTPNNFEIPHVSHNSNLQYVFDAAKHITIAAEYESNRDFEKAFTAYKAGIACLLNGVKDDPDLDRHQLIRHKTAKYLLRAEKIYNIHLNPDLDHFSWNEDVSKKIADSLKIERPLHELNNIKILSIIDSVMLVQYSDDSGLYIIKTVRKHVPQVCSKETPIMPSNIPFMVQLYKYFCTNDTIYILLQYASGGKLWDYLHNSSHFGNYYTKRLESLNIYEHADKILPSPLNTSSEESDKSYSKLIEDYQTCMKVSGELEINENVSELQQINTTEESNETNVSLKNGMDSPEDSEQTKDILQNAHKLMDSVDQVLFQSRKTNDEMLDYVPSFVEINDNSHVKTDDLSLLNEITHCETYCDTDNCLTCWSEEVPKHWNPLNDMKVAQWAAQLLLALESLHRLGIICYDLEPKHLLLDQNGDLLLTYKYYWEEAEIVRCPSYPKCMYSAPEINHFGYVSDSCDWWSYGAILYEMLTGMKLYQCHPGGIHPYTILNIPQFVSPEGQSLLTQLLMYSAEDRLGSGKNGVNDIKAHPFFDSIDWRTLIKR